MTDNSRASLGTQDGDTFAFDDIAGIKFARSKIVIGADGTNDGDVSAANPLPVSGTVAISSGAITTVSTVTTLTGITNALPAGTNVIGHVIVDSGSISATQSGAYNITNISGTVSLPTGAATDTLQTSGNASLTAINNKLPALGAAATTASVPVNIASDQTVPISNANLTTLAALSGTQAASGASQTGVLALTIASDNPVPSEDGRLAALLTDTMGRLRVAPDMPNIDWFTPYALTPETSEFASEIAYV